jgi:hypothetical protein
MWLKRGSKGWFLKVVQSQQDSSISVLSYLHVTELEEIKSLIHAAPLRVDWSDLVVFAQFPVQQFVWPCGTRVEVCQFFNDDYYLLGTLNPQVSSELMEKIDFCYEANAKIIEYLCKFKPNVLKDLQKPLGNMVT